MKHTTPILRVFSVLAAAALVCCACREEVKVTKPSIRKDKKQLPPECQQVAKVRNGCLFIGAKYDGQRDLLIEFSRCMYNRLMTFRQVGLAENSGETAALNPDRSPDVLLNSAFSDNIGPLNIQGGGWCGANHSFAEQNRVHTAAHVSAQFFADGKELRDGDQVRANQVWIKVHNVIFNPLFPPKSGADVLDTPLCHEEVDYTVENGSIFVSLKQTFVNEAPVIVNTYYGMQSMFCNETEIMTPSGPYTEFTPETQVEYFLKSDYPNFRRFIERRSETRAADGQPVSADVRAPVRYYQSAYLLPVGMGMHQEVNDKEFLFTHSYGKCYHRLISGKKKTTGQIVSWQGLYNWPQPLQDNQDLLAYTASRDWCEYLFMDLKRETDRLHFSLPERLKGRKYVVAEKSGGITGFSKAGDGLEITASAPGSLVLVFR